MHLPPLHSLSMSHYCTSGDVTIAPDAAIAAGTVLMADANSRIVIASGACVGLGAVLHAHGGNITIESGASVGAGVLIVGSCRVGTQACVGTSTTIHNANVPPGELVPPASLLGQRGRQPESDASVSPPKSQGPAGVGSTTNKRNSSGGAVPPKTATMEPEPSPWDLPDAGVAEASSSRTESVSPEPGQPESSSESSNRSVNSPSQPTLGKVYGKEQFERIRGAVSS